MEIALIGMVIALISTVIACFTYWKTQKAMPQLIDQLAEGMGTSLRNHVDEQLKPYLAAASTVMNDRGLKGITSRQLKKADELIATDLLNMQDPMIQAGLELLPNLKDWLMDGRIDLIPQLLPRIKALQESGDILGFLKPGGGQGKTKHPYG